MTTRTAPPSDAPAHAGVAALAAVLAELEEDTGLHSASTVEASGAAEWQAQQLGAHELVMRARLLRAGELMRQGVSDVAGPLIHEVHAWAETHGDTPYLLARAHREMSMFYHQVGDTSVALSHAVKAVAHLPADVAPGARVRHLLVLAVLLDETGSIPEADRRFREALDIATALGSGRLILYILNCMAYTAYERDDEPGASELVVHMYDVHFRTGEPLTASHLDTVARVALMAQRYGDVDRTLSRFLVDDEETIGVRLDEGHAIADCLLTLAEARRFGGAHPGAQQALDAALRLCEERQLVAIRVKVREEQAALFAACGRHSEAYEEHRVFHAEFRALHSAQAEARARAVQAVFEAEEARQSSEHFREMAHRDALTGLYNRRYVDERLPALLGEALLRRRPLAVALLDLDHFKRINDTLSHGTGDAVLENVARLLMEAAGDTAVAARLGGEEFLLIFPDLDAADAARRCEALRLRIRAHPWAPITGTLPVTTSIGVTEVAAGRDTPSALLSQADRNLYAAKGAGRNRVAVDPTV